MESMTTSANRTIAEKRSFMKDAPLLAALILLLVSAIALVIINIDALHIDAAVFIIAGCIAFVVWNRP
jgi:Ca2+/Na+ antiporter